MKRYGYWNGKNYDVNMNDIECEMIKEAAKCQSYSSDVVSHILTLRACLEHRRDMYSKRTYLFGFYNEGIDGRHYIQLRQTYDIYRRVCVVQIERNMEKCVVKFDWIDIKDISRYLRYAIITL